MRPDDIGAEDFVSLVKRMDQVEAQYHSQTESQDALHYVFASRTRELNPATHRFGSPVPVWRHVVASNEGSVGPRTTPTCFILVMGEVNKHADGGLARRRGAEIVASTEAGVIH
jgi:hypothetical protein